MYKANICITPRPSILDPQGKTVHHALGELGYDDVKRVRMGKYAELWIAEDDATKARQVAQEACEKLLANPVMEDFEIEIEEVEEEEAA